jgi:spore maturation protein CgeB
MRELTARGHDATALEPADGWSRANLLADAGVRAIAQFARDFPGLRSIAYDETFDHEAVLSSADVVIVHEWTDPALVARVGLARRRGGGFTLLFHDTHHRAVSEAGAIPGLALQDYDAVLAFGETLRERYLGTGWGRRVHTWHEAADIQLFHPHPEIEKDADLVWIGNWGDNERSAEIGDYLVGPVGRLGLSANVHGVRYPAAALAALSGAGIAYRGWVPNAAVPKVFARHRVTIHIPRRPYVESLPGIPTIRMFEALACGIPLISAPWEDAEGLFRPGVDFLFAGSGAAMATSLRRVLDDRDLARSLAAAGLATIKARHTCAHRVDELLRILLHCGSSRVVDQLAPTEAAQ